MTTLKEMLPRAWLELEVRDRSGKVVHRSERRAHSWTRNLYNLLCCQSALFPHDSAYGLNMVDINGAVRSSTYEMPSGAQQYASGYGYRGAEAVDYIGIVVGSGTLPFDFEQYALQSLIPHGTGAGQLSYQACDLFSLETVGTTKRATLRRFFNNNSGATITVSEIGLYDRMAYSRGGDIFTMGSIMTARDVLAAPVDVPDAGQLRVDYLIELTYPA